MIHTFHTGKNRLSTPMGRWAAIGPYYAMFPIAFAFDVVARYCPPGGAVIDPFAGRASSIYAAVSTGRYGCGIELNEVGWLYGKVKLNPAPQPSVIKRNREIALAAHDIEKSEFQALPEFFRYCFTKRVLKYLIAARQLLDWRENHVDATLMALILVYLHGAKEKSLSNQMRQGKAMAPDYCVSWWKERRLKPPAIDPAGFMAKRIRWRYARGIPELHDGSMQFGDSAIVLEEIKRSVEANAMPRFDLLFTSPPYYNVTSYHYDQWLRLWMLGHGPIPSKTGGDWQDGFWSKVGYRLLLTEVFQKCADVLNDDAVVWVRTDARDYTLRVTREVLCTVFPDKQLETIESPLTKDSQTALYGDKTKKPGEIDLVLRR